MRKWDATDAAHPAWWRGNEAGVVATVKIATNAANGLKHSGVYGDTIEEMVNKIEKLYAMRHLPDDDAPLTEEWLRKVGLFDGAGWENKVRIVMHGADFNFLEIRHNAEWAHKRLDCKTIADARTLCRLLGVTLKD